MQQGQSHLCCDLGLLAAAWRRRGLRGLEARRSLQRERTQRAGAVRSQRLVEVTASLLSGESWSLSADADSSGAELKLRVASLTGLPSTELVLVCGAACLSDHDRLASLVHEDAHEASKAAALQVQVVRMPKPTALSGSADLTLKLWDLSTGFCLRTMRGHTRAVTCVEVDWGTRRALSGSCDNTLLLWDLNSCSCIGRLRGHRGPVLCVAVDWAGGRALSGSLDRSLRWWDLDRAECVATLRGHDDAVACMDVDWADLKVLSGGWDCVLCVWDLKHRSAPRREAVLEGHARPVSCASSGWSTARAVSGSWDGSLRIWDLASKRCLRLLDAHAGAVLCLSADWRQLQAVSGSADYTLKLWGLDSGACRQTFVGHRDPVNCVSVDWGARRALSGSGDPMYTQAGEAQRGLEVKLVGFADNSLRLWFLDGDGDSCGCAKGHAYSVMSARLHLPGGACSSP